MKSSLNIKKFLVVADLPSEVIQAIGALDGRIYNPEMIPVAWADMHRGIMVIPKSVGIDEEVIYTPTVARDDIGGTIKDFRKFINYERQRLANLDTRANNPNLPLSDDIARLITKPNALPRRVRVGPFEFDDWTPWCVFPNPMFDFAPSPIRIDQDVEDLVESKGTVTVLPERDVIVTEYAHDHWNELEKTQIESKMLYRGHPMPESGFGIMLPLRGFRSSDGRENKTGCDFIAFGTDLYNEFTRKLCELRLERAKQSGQNIENSIDHALLMTQDYTAWPPSAQEIYADVTFRADLNSFEQSLHMKFASDLDEYFTFIEDNMIDMFNHEPNAYRMKTKPYKSPATDTIMPDGTPFKAKEHPVYPAPYFETEYPEKNAYAKFSYKVLKDAIEPYIVPSVVERFKGLSKGLLHDPTWEFEMVTRGWSREGTIAWRLNCPDKMKLYKNIDLTNSEYSDFKLEDAHMLDKEETWERLHGKPRAVVIHKNFSTYKSLVVPPAVIYNMIKKKRSSLLQHDFVLKTRYGSIRRYPFTKGPSINRARIICPHKWRFNMYDGTIAKFYAMPIEHCETGFPSLKPGSGYEQHYRSRVNKQNCVVWATDVSHFETYASSNQWVLNTFDNYGKAERRGLYFEDAASGWLASSMGRRYHGFQTSSGIGHTTIHSLLTGMFLNAVDICYRDDNHDERVAITAWRCLLWHACDYAIKHFGLTKSNPFGEVEIDHPVYQVNGQPVISLHSAGSDDEGGWDMSDIVSEEAIAARIAGPACEAWRKKNRMSLEFGEGSHFGIVRDRFGFHRDETSSDWKWSFMERRKPGDLIALGIVVAFNMTPGLEEDVQAALDYIGGGSTSTYKIGAECAMQVLQANPAYANEVMLQYYPEETPIGKMLRGKIGHIADPESDANLLKLETTLDIIQTYKNFLGGN